MSDLSLHAVDQLYRTTSEDPALMLLTINFPNLNDFYYVNNTEDITSNGQLFTAFPFEFTLPSDVEGEVPELSIVLSNVGLELIDDFLQNTDSILANVKVIFASRPDIIEIEVSDLQVRKVSANSNSINIILGYEDILNIQIPSYSYSATDFPGLLSV